MDLPRTAIQLKKTAFLKAYSESGNLSLAARKTDTPRSNHYEWLKDPEYVKALEGAQVQAIEVLEAELHRRAVEGVEEPVGWYKGKAGGTVTRYSDNLLMFLLKAVKPTTYRERVEHTGKDGGPITIEHLAPQVRKIEE